MIRQWPLLVGVPVLNQGHPLHPGLVCALPLCPRADGDLVWMVRDYGQGKNWSVRGANEATFIHGGLSFGNLTYIDLNFPLGSGTIGTRLSGVGTILALINRRNASAPPTDEVTICDVRSGAGDGFWLYHAIDNNVTYRVDTGGLADGVANDPGATAGLNVIAGIYDGAAVYAQHNTVRGSGTALSGSMTINQAVPHTLGESDAYTTDPVAWDFRSPGYGVLLGFFAWERVLSQGEVSSFLYDPWQLFDTTPARLIMPMQGAIHGSGPTPGNLVCTAQGTSTASLTLTGAGSVAGSSAGSSTASLALTATGAVAGTAEGTGAATLTLGATGTVAGTASGAGSATLTLSGTGALAGTAAGAGTATLTLSDASLIGYPHYRILLRVSTENPLLKVSTENPLLRVSTANPHMKVTTRGP